VIGLLLIFFSNIMNKNNDSEINNDLPPAVIDDHVESEESDLTLTKSDVAELEKKYATDLEVMLNKLTGITDAEVMINLDSTNINVYEKNIIKGQQTTDETDQSGGIRKVEDKTEEIQAVLTRKGDQEVPLLVHMKKPSVRGVFV